MRTAPDDDAVAWKLAAAAHPHLSRVDADRIYIAIGVGDIFEAIDALLTAIARAGIAVDDDVVATVAIWLNCYRGQDDEVRLRHLLAEVKSKPPQRVPAFEKRFGSALIAARDRGPVDRGVNSPPRLGHDAVPPSNRRAIGQAHPTTQQIAPPSHRL
jgi:hypothetical protein